MDETKQLDAHDALLLMAEAFDVADENGVVLMEGKRFNCLCSAITELRQSGRITADTATVLQKLIHLAMIGKDGVYLFPFTSEGARQRAAWCREQAAKLRPVEPWNGRTTVRCWLDKKHGPTVSAYTDEGGIAFHGGDYQISEPSAYTEARRVSLWESARIEPDTALALLTRSPDSQRKLREMFAAHPVVADAVPPTRVRCWKGINNNMWYMESEYHGHYIEIGRQFTEISAFTISGLNERNSAGLNQEITTADALDLLKDWPEGRELFLAYCREHPPVEEPTPEQPAGVVVTRPVNPYEVMMTQPSDIYDILVAYNVTCPAVQHAVKKLLCAGKRGHKSREVDLTEAKAAIERAIVLSADARRKANHP